jgi:hypothetical protein
VKLTISLFLFVRFHLIAHVFTHNLAETLALRESRKARRYMEMETDEDRALDEKERRDQQRKKDLLENLVYQQKRREMERLARELREMEEDTSDSTIVSTQSSPATSESESQICR